MEPLETSNNLGSNEIIVVLPAPDGPTKATICPGSTVNEISFNTSPDAMASLLAALSSDASEISSALG